MSLERPLGHFSDQMPITGNVDPMVRERILERFAVWLDDVLAKPALPQGLATEIISELQSEESRPGSKPTSGDAPSDLYSLWSAITALSQEVRIQGRTFKQLNDTLEPITELPFAVNEVSKSQRESLEQLSQTVNSLKELHAEQKREMEEEFRVRLIRPLLMVLFDIRDRLRRGLNSVRENLRDAQALGKKSWLESLISRKETSGSPQVEAVKALEEGYFLSLQRLDDELDHLGVRRIEDIGGPFNPHVMNAIEISEVADIPDGTVLEIYRPGYELDGELLRPAEVKVARSKKGNGETAGR